ncbi:MAG: hypothetical protein H6713_39835 [Myxococcales bacterium]|nr:hypothetical protein [Myxococcales bacterium]
MPRTRIRARPAPWILVCASATLALTQLACDERLAERITAASKRQEEREDAIDEAVKRLEHDSVPAEIREYLDAVERSDYTFIVVKGDSRRAMNGYDFTGMLEGKTKMLGRDIEDAALWLDEIGSGTFFKQVPYLVRLPSGEEVQFRGWVEREVENHRRYARESGERRPARAPARTRARVTAAIDKARESEREVGDAHESDEEDAP